MEADRDSMCEKVTQYKSQFLSTTSKRDMYQKQAFEIAKQLQERYQFLLDEKVS